MTNGLACRGVCIPSWICLPRPSLSHHQTSHAEWCYRQRNVLHGISWPFHVCHKCSGWTCSHLCKAQGTSGGPASSGVQWQMQIELHGAGQWAQRPLEDVGPSGHPHEVCFWLLGQRHSHQWPAGGHFVGLCQCSSFSSLHKGADPSLADELRTFYGPVQLS